MNCLTLKQQGTKCLCFVASHVTNGEQHCVFVKEFIRIFWLPTDSGRYSTVTPKLILIMPCFLSLSAGIMPCDPMAVNSTKGNKMQRNFPKHKFQSKCNYVCCNNFPERGGKGTPLKRVRMWGSCVAHMYALASICSAWIVRRKFSSSSSLLACKSNNKVRKESYPCSEGNTNSKELQTKLELAAKKFANRKEELERQISFMTMALIRKFWVRGMQQRHRKQRQQKRQKEQETMTTEACSHCIKTRQFVPASHSSICNIH